MILKENLALLTPCGDQMPFASREDYLAYHKRYYEANKHKGWNKHLESETPLQRQERLAEMRAYQLKRNFGLTTEQYDQRLADQGGKCAICLQEPRAKAGRHNKTASLAIDHCHKTGKVRKLLCTTCNLRLGWFERYKDAVSSYLHEEN